MIIFLRKKEKKKKKGKNHDVHAYYYYYHYYYYYFVTYVTRVLKDELETLMLHERVENIIWNRLKDYNKFHAYGMAY